MNRSENDMASISNQTQTDYYSETAPTSPILKPDDFRELLSANPNDSNDPNILIEELENLRHIKQKLIHNADRMERSLKEQIRKRRTSRLIHWGAELEHQLKLYAPAHNEVIEQITQEQQKELMQYLFTNDDIRDKILQILSDVL